MLLQQEITVTYPDLFENVLGLIPYRPDSRNIYYKLNDQNSANGIGFFIEEASSSNKSCSLSSKKNNAYKNIYSSNSEHYKAPFVYQTGENKTVIYFKQLESSNYAGKSGFTCVLAQDINNEWVLFNEAVMCSDYGDTGLYPNLFDGFKNVVPDDNSQFMIAPAARYDTGVKFKDLFFVHAAKNYSESNCLVAFEGKPYRLVSLSQSITTRYPCLAFPVSDN